MRDGEKYLKKKKGKRQRRRRPITAPRRRSASALPRTKKRKKNEEKNTNVATERESQTGSIAFFLLVAGVAPGDPSRTRTATTAASIFFVGAFFCVFGCRRINEEGITITAFIEFFLFVCWLVVPTVRLG